jgi:polyhydroxyalkanoate synthesis repressor PhaR
MSDESTTDDPSDKAADTIASVVIKKYANRRLYNTHTSSYVTLEHLAQMVKDGQEFTVHDAKSGEDITRSVLTQIIVEEEAKGQNLLPISFLRQLIALYGDNLQGIVPQYLDVMMQSFADNQDQIRTYLNGTLGGFNPFQQMEELSRGNMKVFEQAMNMFTPPTSESPPAGPEAGSDPQPPADNPAPESENSAFEDLQSQLRAMQRQLDALAGKDGK